MLHEPALPAGKDPSSPYKARLGVQMFIVYALFYAGFIGINVYDPLMMERLVTADLNLAVVYGFLLIGVALVLALIYDFACASKEREMAEPVAATPAAPAVEPGKGA